MKQTKKEPTQDFWFFLYPYVYLDVKAGKAIIYNTLNGVLLEYDSPVIVEILSSLYKWETTVIDLNDFSCDDPVVAMIEDVRNSFSGDLIAKSSACRKPFQFQPRLFFDNTFDSEYSNYSIPVLNSEQPKDYLEELSIYINSECQQKCRDCKSYYKQTYFCTVGSRDYMYPFDDLKQLFNQARKTALKRVNLLGGDIFLYPHLPGLIAYLNDYPANIYYYINHLHLDATSKRLIDLINWEKDTCVVLVPPPLTESSLHALLSTPGLKDHFFTFLVSSENDYDDAVTFIDKYSLEHTSVVPIYGADNKSFFERNVFVTRESIAEEHSDIVTILRRSHLNDAGFKKLFVMPDKKIFSNLNLPAIADLGQNSLIYAIKRELKDGTYWKLLRKNVAPCTDCPFQSLCPPVSNYDFALNQHNLCTIWEKEK